MNPVKNILGESRREERVEKVEEAYGLAKAKVGRKLRKGKSMLENKRKSMTKKLMY
jgi:hypothetical protein